MIDLSGLTLNTEEARYSSQAVFERTFDHKELTELYDVQTGIEMDTQIPVFGKIGLVGKLDPGDCSVNASTESIGTSEKVWSPKKVSFRLTHCQDSAVSRLFKIWKKAKQATKEWEYIEDEMLAFMEDRVMKATLESIYRLADFGDTAADNVTGGGNITDGIDAEFFQPIDGLWKQIIAGVTGGDIAARYTIAKNSEATKALQMALDADTAITVLRALFSNADSRLFQGDMRVIYVTRSLFENWQTYIEDTSKAFTLDKIEQGSTRWAYRGVPIIPRYDWDDAIVNWFDQGATYLLPHRAIMTDLANIPLGTPETDSFKSFDMFYHRKDKQHYSDVAYRLDAKYLEGYRISVAY